jgi:hypothetical protein
MNQAGLSSTRDAERLNSMVLRDYVEEMVVSSTLKSALPHIGNRCRPELHETSPSVRASLAFSSFQSCNAKCRMTRGVMHVNGS